MLKSALKGAPSNPDRQACLLLVLAAALAQVREQLHMQKRTASNRWVRDTVTQRHVRQDVPWGLQDGSATLPVIDAARAAHLALPLVGAVPHSPWQAAHHPTTLCILTLLQLAWLCYGQLAALCYGGAFHCPSRAAPQWRVSQHPIGGSSARASTCLRASACWASASQSTA